MKSRAKVDTKYVNKGDLHDKANVIRIDLLILKIIRNHWIKVRDIEDNSLMFSSTYP